MCLLLELGASWSASWWILGSDSACVLSLKLRDCHFPLPPLLCSPATMTTPHPSPPPGPALECARVLPHVAVIPLGAGHGKLEEHFAGDRILCRGLTPLPVG